MAAVIRYYNRLSSNSGAVRRSYDNSGTAPDVPVHLATMLQIFALSRPCWHTW